MYCYYLFWGDKKCVCVFGELRIDNDIKQEEIARILNVAQVTYSRYETGTRCIPYEALVTLAEYYNTSIDYLFGLTDERKPYTRIKGTKK
jgi:transcriptional regulator with XRE-family HTH domain